MEFASFFFTSFWHFAGLVVVIGVTGEAVAEIAKALRSRSSGDGNG